LVRDRKQTAYWDSWTLDISDSVAGLKVEKSGGGFEGEDGCGEIEVALLTRKR